MISDRIKELRIALDLSQDTFGRQIGITKAAISRIEAGLNNPAEQTILSICREYNANEEWLRTGEGQMFNDMTRAEMAARIVGNALNTDNDFILRTFIALGQLSPADWEAVERFIDKIREDK